MSTFFVKTNKANTAIVVSSKPMTTKTYTINGKEVTVRQQATGVKMGFVAITDPESLGLKPGEKVPFTISDVPVLDMDKQPLTNLFWAE
jgi:hypothetical protein